MKTMMKWALPLATMLAAPMAWAHLSLAGPVYANTSQVLTFGVGHGCEGADTYRVEVRIPAGVTSVRALPSSFGNGIVQTNEAGDVTAVIWTKPVADVLPGDTQYYQVALRAKTPDAAFTKLIFPAIQTCRTPEGVETTTEWIGTGAQGETAEPAPAIVLLPARKPGWNKYTVTTELADLSAFADAQIVWSGNAAYSANAEIAKLIEDDATVDTLTSIAAGATIWVKY